MYRLSGLIGASMLVAMLAMVVAQMIARWLEISVTGLTEIAGYLMGATSFFGLGYALSEGAHVRVGLIVGTGEHRSRIAEIICTSMAAIIAAALAFFAIRTTVLSYQFQEISQGQDEIATWIPQTTMCIGTVVLVIALLDRLVSLLTAGSSADERLM